MFLFTFGVTDGIVCAGFTDLNIDEDAKEGDSWATNLLLVQNVLGDRALQVETVSELNEFKSTFKESSLKARIIRQALAEVLRGCGPVCGGLEALATNPVDNWFA